MKLTERDKKILLELHDNKYLSTSQIKTLLFPSLKKASGRLKILFDNGFIASFEKMTFSLGRGESVFYLKKKGLEQISSLINTPLQNLASVEPPKSLLFIEHLLSINDFRIYLKLACENSRYSFSFIPEYRNIQGKGKRLTKYIKDTTEDPDNSDKQISFIPDAVFNLADSKSKKKLLFFLEVDRGTETIESPINSSNFLNKIKTYCSYFDNKGYQRYDNDFNYEFNGFRVLTVTTSELRMNNLKKACLKYGDVSIFWFTTFEKLSSDTILEKIWEIANPEDKTMHFLVESSKIKAGVLGGG